MKKRSNYKNKMEKLNFNPCKTGGAIERKKEQAKFWIKQNYFPHLKDYIFPKPTHNIFPSNFKDKNWKACDFRTKRGKYLSLYIFWENMELNKADIYSRLKGYAGIYILINRVNNETYIGSSCDLTKRMTHYFHKANCGKTLRVIDKVFRKYGLKNFSLGILFYIDRKQFYDKNYDRDILKWEQNFINLVKPKYNSIKSYSDTLD